MKGRGVVKTTGLIVITSLVFTAGAGAQEPPPAQPPVTVPPVSASPVAAEAAAPAPAARVTLTGAELLRRRNAIFIMEGMLVNSVLLAASHTQEEIEAAQPELKVTLFAPTRPEARGNYLEDYGVFFQVLIPSYQPSVVSILNMLPQNPAQPTAAARSLPLNPDAVYVTAVKNALTDAMLEYSKALDLRPSEWLTVAARGADGGPGPAADPSVLILRIKGADLNDFLTGRVTKDEVLRRVELRGFSGR